jgi:hypothetical protein
MRDFADDAMHISRQHEPPLNKSKLLISPVHFT